MTADVLTGPEGACIRRPGGAAFYSALQAARLRLRTLIVTKGDPHELQDLLRPYSNELEVLVLPSAHTTTLLTSGAGGTRRQRVLHWAGAIPEEAVPSGAKILQLAPIANETPPLISPQAHFVALTPQGLLRSWSGPSAEMTPTPLRLDALPGRCDAIVISESERHTCPAIIPEPHRRTEVLPSAVIAVTAGSQPTTVYLPGGRPLHVCPPAIAHPVDDLGAGDVFAAAFFIALADGATPAHAAEFGNAAAAFRIAGEGPGAIGRRDEIEGLLISSEATSAAGKRPPASEAPRAAGQAPPGQR